jgi:hypothetical protein
MKTIARPPFSMDWIAWPFVLGLLAGFIVTGGAVPAAAQNVSVDYCAPNSPPQDLTLFVGDLNGGVPLPRRFTNGTLQFVGFTTIMKTNRFFGRERLVDLRVVRPRGTEIGSRPRQELFRGVDETTPLGTDTVVIEVFSDATGPKVLGRCTFNLTVTRRPEQRDIIGIPLRPCVLEGTTLAFDNSTSSFLRPGQFIPQARDVTSLIDQINDRTWLRDARIVFRPAGSLGVPVIKDPFPPEPEKTCGLFSRAFPDPVGGCLGDINPGGIEGDVAVTACEKAWKTQKGLVVVFARHITDGSLGFVPRVGALEDIDGPDNIRLCRVPRNLRDDDLTRKYVFTREPGALAGQAVGVLAHELGHALFLGHGNGLDDNNNSTLQRREYDEYCESLIRGIQPGSLDPNEDKLTPGTDCESSKSVMQATLESLGTSSCPNLRPLQVEQARAAAKRAPGASYDMAADPAGALVADIPLPPPQQIPLDILIAKAELAETPEIGITAVSQTVLGALPSDAHNRYSVFLDLDNNASSGCTPATLGLPTRFTGAEAVTSVTLKVAGGAAPQLVAKVWICGGSEFIPLSDPEISADASDVGLSDVSGPSRKALARINVTLPTSLLGPRADQVRVQAVAEQLRPGSQLDRLPRGEGEGGVIILPAPDLPRCSVSAPVVNPGSVTHVQASDFPPGELVDVFLGGTQVGTGEVDDAGVADVELPIPSTSPPGPRPVLLQLSDTLFLATCEVEVVGEAVTPVTTASVTPEPNAAGWNNTPVTVTLTAVSEGATVTSLTFSATGAQAMPEETVAGDSAVIPISAEGETTLTYFAIDSSDRIEPAAQLVIRIDTTRND